MEHQVKSTILFNYDDYMELKHKAVELHLSMSEIIRVLLRLWLSGKLDEILVEFADSLLRGEE